jgi:hypothetical protein
MRRECYRFALVYFESPKSEGLRLTRPLRNYYSNLYLHEFNRSCIGYFIGEKELMSYGEAKNNPSNY